MNSGPQPNSEWTDEALCDLFAPLFIREHDLKGFVDWAAQQLSDGTDTPSLRILAGLSGNDSVETEFYLRRTFQELGLTWPEENNCLLHFCARLARQIVNGSVSPEVGYSQIYQVAVHLNYAREMLRWVRLDVEFYPHEGAPDERAQRTELIRNEAKRFLLLIDNYKLNGAFRLSIEQSYQKVCVSGFAAPAIGALVPKSMASADDKVCGLSFSERGSASSNSTI